MTLRLKRTPKLRRDFALNLKRYREARGISQVGLAGKVKCVRQTIINYENGVSVPDVARAYAIAKALGCTVHDLIGEPRR